MINYKGIQFTLKHVKPKEDIVFDGECINIYDIEEEPTYRFNELPKIYTKPTILLYNVIIQDEDEKAINRDLYGTDVEDLDLTKVKIIADVDLTYFSEEIQEWFSNINYNPLDRFNSLINTFDISTIQHHFIRQLLNEIDVYRNAKYINSKYHMSEDYIAISKASTEIALIKPFGRTNLGDIYSEQITHFSDQSYKINLLPTLRMQYENYKEICNGENFIMLVLYKYDVINDIMHIIGSTIEPEREKLLPKLSEASKIQIYNKYQLETFKNILKKLNINDIYGKLGFFHYASNKITFDNIFSMTFKLEKDIQQPKRIFNSQINDQYASLYNAVSSKTSEESLEQIRSYLKNNYGLNLKIKTLDDLKKNNSNSNKNANKKLNGITSEIKEWMSTITFNDFCEEIKKRVIGQDQLTIVLTIVWTYLKGLINDEVDPTAAFRNNTIITAPSGTGKTETYKALKAYFKEAIPSMPVLLLDSTKVTSEGFKGKNTSEWMADLITAGTDGIGLVFLDEFDKQLSPKYSSHGENISESIQGQLLKIIEGDQFESINTMNTLFIGIGSFDHMRAYKKEQYEKNQKIIGFNTLNDKDEVDFYNKITNKDMIDAGGTRELVARFPIVVNYGKLSEESIRIIIDRFKDNIEKAFSSTIQLDEEYLKYLVTEASGELGLRNIYNIMLEKFLPIYSRLLLKEKESRLIILTKDEDLEEYFTNLALESSNTDDEDEEEVVELEDVEGIAEVEINSIDEEAES